MELFACINCDDGYYEDVIDDYKTTTPNDKIYISHVKLKRCNLCGEELLPPETQRLIDEVIANSKL